MTPVDLLFDLDGTLSDPIEGIWRSINHALSWLDHPTLGIDEVRQYIGPPIDRTLSRITGVTSQTDLYALVAKYRERYSAVGYAENILYPGVADSLAQLRERGFSMAVCTSKKTDFAERILELFSLRSYFDYVDGGDIGVEKWQQIESLRANAWVSARSIMIGDRASDLLAARKNGLIGAAVMWGYGSSSELLCEDPAYVFRTPSEWLHISS